MKCDVCGKTIESWEISYEVKSKTNSNVVLTVCTACRYGSNKKIIELLKGRENNGNVQKETHLVQSIEPQG